MIHIPKAEYTRRRKALMAQMEPNSIAILPAAPVRLRNGDIEYVYRQDSHFHYLCGFPEPDAVAVLGPGRPQGEYLLFVREHDASGVSLRMYAVTVTGFAFWIASIIAWHRMSMSVSGFKSPR